VGQNRRLNAVVKLEQKIHWPLFIAGLVTLALITVGALFLNPRRSSASAADDTLRAYLYRVVIAQARYFQRNKTYATSLEALRQQEDALQKDSKTPKVLEPALGAYRLQWQFADKDDYCVIAASEGGERWYTVSSAGVRRSQTVASEPFTGTCPALKRPS
jgi:hypothetical protein